MGSLPREINGALGFMRASESGIQPSVSVMTVLLSCVASMYQFSNFLEKIVLPRSGSNPLFFVALVPGKAFRASDLLV